MRSDETRHEAIERCYAAFNDLDYDRAMEFVHSDVEYVGPGGQKPVAGATAVRAWMEFDAFESQRVEFLEIESAGDRSLVLSRAKNRVAGSGIEMEIEVWSVFSFDDAGRITRQEVFLPHQEEEARRAAGLLQ